MKYLRAFEEMNQSESEIGDYVLCTNNLKVSKLNNFFSIEQKYNDFISNNVGQIIKITIIHDFFPSRTKYTFFVKYKNIPNEILPYGFITPDYFKREQIDIEFDIIESNNTRYEHENYRPNYTNISSFNSNEIVYFSKNEEDVKTFIQSNKYNI